MQTQTNRISRYMLWHNAEFTLTDDRAALDMTYLHAFLTNSYWAQGIPLETVIRSLDNSLCFGLRPANARSASAAPSPIAPP